MAFFQSFRNSNGTWTTVRWTVSEWLTAKWIGMLVVLVAVHMLVFAGAIWFWLIYFFDIEEHRYWDKRWGVGCSLFFFLDYYFGGIGYRFFFGLFGDSGALMACRFMVTFFVYHLLMCFFDRALWNHIINHEPDKSEYENKWTMWWISFCFLGVFFWQISPILAPLFPHAVIAPMNAPVQP